MAVYATIDDVQRRMPQFTLTEQTKPSISSSQDFLDDTHAQFESAMENLGYRLPITGARSLAQSKEIVSQGTICKILYARAAAVGTDVAVQSAERACKQYDEALKRLADPDNPVELSDAARTDDEVTKLGSTVGGLTVEPDGSAVEPRITMDTRF